MPYNKCKIPMENWEQFYKVESVKLDKLGGAVTNWQQAEESKNWSKAALRVKGDACCLLKWWWIEIKRHLSKGWRLTFTNCFWMREKNSNVSTSIPYYCWIQTVIKWHDADNSKTEQDVQLLVHHFDNVVKRCLKVKCFFSKN